MKYLIFILILFQGIALKSQNSNEAFDEYVIVTASILTIRSAPDIKSKKIGFARKGAFVKVVDPKNVKRKLVHVDGKLDTWFKIEYNGINGYMFGHYLSKKSIIKMPNENWDAKYLVLSEYRRLKEVIYSTDLNWYGIYSKDDGEYIEAVDVSIKFIPEKEHPELELENHLKIETNNAALSLLLIGTNEPMEIGRVGIKVPSFYQRQMHNDTKLPIPFFSDSCMVNNSFYIHGGNSTNDTNQCYLENYRVTVRKDNNWRIEEIFLFDDLVEVLRGEGRDGCNLPSLYWYGDINNDSIPDLVFYTSKVNFGKCKVYLSEVVNGQVKYNPPIVYQPIFHMG